MEPHIMKNPFLLCRSDPKRKSRKRFIEFTLVLSRKNTSFLLVCVSVCVRVYVWIKQKIWISILSPSYTFILSRLLIYKEHTFAKKQVEEKQKFTSIEIDKISRERTSHHIGVG